MPQVMILGGGPLPAPRVFRFRPLGWAGFEQVEVTPVATGILVRSFVIGAHEAGPYAVRYELRLDAEWLTRSVQIERLDGKRLLLAADGKGNWSDGVGRPIPALAGSIDLDISGTPITNTLPIRRCKWASGAPQTLRMAFIRLDTLEFSADLQTYTRLDDTHFRYTSGDGGFDKVLTVDAEGFVLAYPTLFERVADPPRATPVTSR